MWHPLLLYDIFSIVLSSTQTWMYVGRNNLALFEGLNDRKWPLDSWSKWVHILNFKMIIELMNIIITFTYFYLQIFFILQSLKWPILVAFELLSDFFPKCICCPLLKTWTFSRPTKFDCLSISSILPRLVLACVPNHM